MTRRAFLYTRLSDPSKQEENYSRPEQHRLGYELADALGATVLRVYDEGESAETLFGRPQMMALLAAIQQGELRRGDVVIALKVNRLARNPWDLGTILRTCQYHGVEIKLCSGEMPTGEHADISIFVEGWSADKQRRDFIDNAWRSLRAKAAAGKPLGFGPAPFGLKYGDERDRHGNLTKERYEPDPATIDWLRWIFATYDGGSSIRQLAKGLEAHGVHPPYFARTGSPRWNISTLRDILTNRAYLGEGTAFDQTWTTTPDGRKKLVKRQPDDPGAVPLPPGVFPVVIDRDQFERIQARLAANRRETQRHDRDPQYAIFRKQHIRCGVCGGAVAVKTGARGRKYYACNNAERGCGKAAMSCAQLDCEAWPWVFEVLTRPAVIEERLSQLRTADPTGPDLAAVETRLREIHRKRRNVLTLIEDLEDEADRREATDRLAALATLRHEAEAERALILAQRASWEAGTARVQSAVEYVAQVRQEVMDETRALDYAAKRRALFRLGVTVTLFPDGSLPRWGLTMLWEDKDVTGTAVPQRRRVVAPVERPEWAHVADVNFLATTMAFGDAPARTELFDSGSGSGVTSARGARRAPAGRTAPAPPSGR